MFDDPGGEKEKKVIPYYHIVAQPVGRGAVAVPCRSRETFLGSAEFDKRLTPLYLARSLAVIVVDVPEREKYLIHPGHDSVLPFLIYYLTCTYTLLHSLQRCLSDIVHGALYVRDNLFTQNRRL